MPIAMPTMHSIKGLLSLLTLVAVLAIPTLRAPCYLLTLSSSSVLTCCSVEESPAHSTGCCQDPAPGPEWSFLLVALPTEPIFGLESPREMPLYEAELDLRAGREGLGKRLLPRAPPSGRSVLT